MPDRSAAGSPGIVVRGPGIVAKFAGGWHGIERPQQATVVSAVGFYSPSGGKFSACEASYDHALEIQRCAGDGVALFPGFGLNRPNLFAAVFVQCLQHSIQLSYKDLVFAKAHPATGPSTTDRRNLVSKMSRGAPQDFPGFNVECEDIVSPGDDIHDPFMDYGLRLPRVLPADPRPLEMSTPDRTKSVDVFGVDLRQCREVSVEEIPAVG